MNRFERRDYGKWDVYRKSYAQSELLARRAQLAKVANSRIRALERAKSYITGKRLIDSPWYDVTLDYLEGQNKKRFSESPNFKGRDYQLKREITVLEEFLAMRSSTVGGYRQVEDKRIQSFVAKGIPAEIASSTQWFDFLNSETFSLLEESIATSEDIIDAVERFSDRGLSLEEMIEEFNRVNSTPRSTYEDLVDNLNARVLTR